MFYHRHQYTILNPSQYIHPVMIDQWMQDQLAGLPIHMDFTGQKVAEQLFQVIIVLFGAIGFCIGFATDRMCYSMYTLAVGCVIASVVTLPPWKCFRSTDDITWLPPYAAEQEQAPSSSSGKKSAPKSKKR